MTQTYTGLHDKHVRRSLQWRNPRRVSRLEQAECG